MPRRSAGCRVDTLTAVEPTREQAWDTLTRYTKSEALLRHALAVEASTRETLESVYRTAYAAYEELVEAGIAREIARCVLPVGAYTEFFWTVNARALMNFVSLRAAETAQREIRRYAEAVDFPS